jgi:hypothetical protein
MAAALRLRLSPRLAAGLAAALLLAACGTPGVKPGSGGAPVPEEVLEHPSEAKDQLKPMPIEPLNVQADCAFTDEAGYSARTRLDISTAEVHGFSARVDVPRRGNCRFDLADFHQVRREPHVELRAKDGCTVSMWEQGDQVTVAFTQCASRCSRGTFEYVWPILLDRSSGQCH